MPIYEFYCEPCHTIFNFLSRRVNTTATPPCPACTQPLSRQVSAFAHLRSGSDAAGGAADDGTPAVDEARMEQAMAAMGSEIDSLGDDTDPQQAASLMRRFAQASGMKFNDTVQEALSRMASGVFGPSGRCPAASTSTTRSGVSPSTADATKLRIASGSPSASERWRSLITTEALAGRSASRKSES